jgi:toluene monooxygenase electron transfer component
MKESAGIFRVRIEGSDEVYDCESGDTILRAALRTGFGFPYECNSGSCGSCRFTLIEGEVEDAWPQAPGLTEQERREGKRLGCQSRPRTDCRLRVRLHPTYVPPLRPRVFRAELMEVRDLTHDLREFRFHAEGAAEFRPGQYGLLRIPGMETTRAYSMCNLANDRGAWHFQVKRVAGGAATTILFERFGNGDSVEIDAPYGRAFLHPDRPRDIVCIAGGSGLSPMISIARAFARAPEMAERRLDFFYGGRGPRDICGKDILAELPGFGERIRFLPVISMPELDTRNEWTGATGLIHEHIEETLDPAFDRYEYYMAGPPPMIDALREMLVLRHKVPATQIHYDRFF